MKKILVLIIFSLFLIAPAIVKAEDFKITEVKISNFGIGQQSGPPGGQSGGPSSGPSSGPNSEPPGGQPSGSSSGPSGSSPAGQTNGSGSLVYYTVNFFTNQPAKNGDLLIKSKENAGQQLEISGFYRLSETGSQDKPQRISDTEFSFPRAGHPLFTAEFYGDWIIVDSTSANDQKAFSDVYLISPDGKLEKVGSVPANADPTSRQGQEQSPQGSQTPMVTSPTAQSPQGSSGFQGKTPAEFCRSLPAEGILAKLMPWACDRVEQNKAFISITSEQSPYVQKWGTTYWFIGIASSFVMNYIIFVGMALYILWIVTKIKPYGIVFDSKTKTPIQGAIVRIFDAEKNKLLETKVTDQAGNYNFIVRSGLYYISIIKPQFAFPTKQINKTEIPQYYRIYKGELIRVTGNTNLSINIPLDPQTKEEVKSTFANRIKKIFSYLVFFLIKIRWIFIFITLPAGILLYLIKIDNWYIYFFGGIFALILEVAWFIAGRRIQLKEKDQ